MHNIPVERGYGVVFHGAGKSLEWREFALPELRRGEVLVKLEYATICGSDLKTFQGKRIEPVPCILGHEMVGRIAQMNGRVLDHYGNSLQPGDRVSWTIYAFDPEDPNALKGIPQKSANLKKYGHLALNEQHYLSGGYASHCHLLAGTSLVRIPDELSDRLVAPLNCAWATVAGGYRLLGDCHGKSVLIYGFGMLGVAACAMAKKKGAKWVGVVDLQQARLDRAADFGADVAFLANEGRIPSGIDVVIDLTGVPDTIEEGIDRLGTGGTMLLLGATYPARDLQVNAEQLLRKILTIKGLHNYAPGDLVHAFEFICEHHREFPLEDLVSKEFALSQLEEAMEYAPNRPDFRVGIVIDPPFSSRSPDIA